MDFRRESSLLLIGLAYVGFVSLGLPDAVIGVAWPSVRERFDLPQGALGWALAAAGAGYFVTSFLAGRLAAAVGIGMLLAGSTGVTAAAMFGFAEAPIWWLFVACAVVHGLGSGGIDAGLNGYAAHHLSARHMNWLHACYCFGAMLGPLVMTAALTGGAGYATGYAAVGAVLLALATMFLLTRRQWGAAAGHASRDVERFSAREALRHGVVRLQIVVFFIYTGIEVALSQWAYTVLTEARGVRPEAAGAAVAAYWGSIGAGRVAFGAAADRVGLDRLLRGCLLLAAAGTAMFALPLGIGGGVAGLVLAGIGLAPVFPCLMTRTPERLGSGLSAHAIGFQVGGAMLGAAALPAALGIVASGGGLPAVPIGMVVIAVALWLLHEWLVQRGDVAAGRSGG